MFDVVVSCFEFYVEVLYQFFGDFVQIEFVIVEFLDEGCC